jgi:hypothetical protein
MALNGASSRPFWKGRSIPKRFNCLRAFWRSGLVSWEKPQLPDPRYEEDLVDQLFNSSEKRLARILLLLAHFGKEGVPQTLIPKMSQETLAEMMGTTRSRVSFS